MRHATLAALLFGFASGACCAPAVAQVKHGTVNVIYFSDEKIAMAADSREAFTAGAPPDDRGCKVAALRGNTIFTVSGAIAYEGDGISMRPWNSLDEAYRIANSQLGPLVTFGDINTLATDWASTMRFKWARLRAVHPEDVTRAVNQSTEGDVEDAYFGGLAGAGRLVLFSVHIFPNDGDIAQTVVQVTCANQEQFCSMGSGSGIVSEFVNQTSERAQKEASRWRPPPSSGPEDFGVFRAMRLVQLAERYYGRDVGGPVDAVQLSRDGSIKWYARKPNCQDH
jgi:hypothetical protein